MGPSSAARLLGDVGDIARFPDKARFATWNGTAPIDASSGDHHRHRLSRAGNRRINRVLHVMAIVQLRNDTPGRAYYRRKLAAGKSPMEAIRCLKRRLSDTTHPRRQSNAHTSPLDIEGSHERTLSRCARKRGSTGWEQIGSRRTRTTALNRTQRHSTDAL
ncbi:transposase [Actinokineospora sp. NPDC004072]